MLALDGASDCVDVLIEEGWHRTRSRCSPRNERHSAHQEAFESKLIPECWQTFHDDDEEFCGHVLRFNNLERAVVVLCVNGFEDVARAPEQFVCPEGRGVC